MKKKYRVLPLLSLLICLATFTQQVQAAMPLFDPAQPEIDQLQQAEDVRNAFIARFTPEDPIQRATLKSIPDLDSGILVTGEGKEVSFHIANTDALETESYNFSEEKFGNKSSYSSRLQINHVENLLKSKGQLDEDFSFFSANDDEKQEFLTVFQQVARKQKTEVLQSILDKYDAELVINPDTGKYYSDKVIKDNEIVPLESLNISFEYTSDNKVGVYGRLLVDNTNIGNTGINAIRDSVVYNAGILRHSTSSHTKALQDNAIKVLARADIKLGNAAFAPGGIPLLHIRNGDLKYGAAVVPLGDFVNVSDTRLLANLVELTSSAVIDRKTTSTVAYESLLHLANNIIKFVGDRDTDIVDLAKDGLPEFRRLHSIADPNNPSENAEYISTIASTTAEDLDRLLPVLQNIDTTDFLNLKGRDIHIAQYLLSKLSTAKLNQEHNEKQFQFYIPTGQSDAGLRITTARRLGNKLNLGASEVIDSLDVIDSTLP